MSERATLPMQSKPEIFAVHAAECRRRAQATTDSKLTWLFSDLADQWLELAATARLLEAEQKEREQFFRGRPSVRTKDSLHRAP
jgi:hypothetical protein